MATHLVVFESEGLVCNSCKRMQTYVVHSWSVDHREGGGVGVWETHRKRRGDETGRRGDGEIKRQRDPREIER